MLELPSPVEYVPAVQLEQLVASPMPRAVQVPGLHGEHCQSARISPARARSARHRTPHLRAPDAREVPEWARRARRGARGRVGADRALQAHARPSPRVVARPARHARGRAQASSVRAASASHAHARLRARIQPRSASRAVDRTRRRERACPTRCAGLIGPVLSSRARGAAREGVADRGGDRAGRTGPARRHVGLPAHIQVRVERAARAVARTHGRVVPEVAGLARRLVAEREGARPAPDAHAGSGIRIRSRRARVASRGAPELRRVAASHARGAVLGRVVAGRATRGGLVRPGHAGVAHGACTRKTRAGTQYLGAMLGMRTEARAHHGGPDSGSEHRPWP